MGTFKLSETLGFKGHCAHILGDNLSKYIWMILKTPIFPPETIFMVNFNLPPFKHLCGV